MNTARSKTRSKNNQGYIGAIDVGGTKMASALFTENGRSVFRSRVITHEAGGREAVEQIVSLHFQLEAEARKRGQALMAMGLCVPGVVNPRTGLVWAPNIKGWKDFPLVKSLKKEIPKPVSVISDRTAYVLGEVWKGAACGQKNVIYLAVGTGIGAGIMADGQVIHGEGDLAGAVGWMALNREFKEEYLKLGCFEWEGSGGAFARKAQALIESHPEIFSKKKNTGNEAEKSAVERVCEEARKGQPIALKLIEEIQDYLAMGVANLVSIFNPEVVVLGGGLFQSADLFFEPIKKKFKLWAQPLASKTVKIVLSALGQDAALYGCARAVLEKNKGRISKRQF
ncbi:ROK family protein [Candidatus Bipolaricaulota bacterium]|nr:ROK family protein [Candidatus Bipolaricaulota bacterium]